MRYTTKVILSVNVWSKPKWRNHSNDHKNEKCAGTLQGTILSCGTFNKVPIHFRSNAARAPDIPLGPLYSLPILGVVLPRFVRSLGGCSLASLSRWGDAPLLHSVAGGTLPRFAQSLGGRSLASLSHWGTLSRRWAQPIIGAII